MLGEYEAVLNNGHRPMGPRRQGEIAPLGTATKLNHRTLTV